MAEEKGLFGYDDYPRFIHVGYMGDFESASCRMALIHAKIAI